MSGWRSDFYRTSAWKRTRKAILERDHYQCQIRGPRCTKIANQVDHIVPISQGGAKLEPANLRASCAKCNNARIDRSRSEEWRAASTHIVLVIGPPAGGKSTYVREHAQPGDLIIDYDAIAVSLGADPHQIHGALHPSINAARNALLRQLRRGATGAPRAWLLSANPEAERRFPFHEIVMVDPGEARAVENARAAGRPADYVDAIRRWYEARQAPSTGNASRDW